MLQTIDVSENGYHLSCKQNHLLASRKEDGQKRFCLSDIHSIVIHAQQTTYSHNLFQECSEKGIHIIACDKFHLPSFILYPFGRHFKESGRIALQAAASLPTKKRIWQQIVKRKLLRQRDILKLFKCKRADTLMELSRLVKSGDSDNREAVGARLYWGQLFGRKFQRNRLSGGLNAALNYGYIILRSGVARAISGAGLCPALGIHHVNKLNSFCLVDDLMEPFRPLVDYFVKIREQDFKETEELTKGHRAYLCEILEYEITFGYEQYSLTRGLPRYIHSFVNALQDNRKKLILPVKLP